MIRSNAFRGGSVLLVVWSVSSACTEADHDGASTVEGGIPSDASVPTSSTSTNGTGSGGAPISTSGTGSTASGGSGGSAGSDEGNSGGTSASEMGGNGGTSSDNGGTGGTSTGGSGGTSDPSSGGNAGTTTCSISGSPSPGTGSLTWYYFAQGTYQENGTYATACGYRGTASGTVDTVQNIASTPPASASYFVAIPGNSPSDFNTRHYCGACLEVENGDKSIIATIIDECPISSNPACAAPGHLDLSKTAFDQLGFPVGNPSGVTWRFVPCPVTGNVVVRIKPENPDQVYIENVILPIKNVIMNGAQAMRLSYGAWQLPGNAAGATLTLVDMNDRTITVQVSGGDTGKQFPRCE